MMISSKSLHGLSHKIIYLCLIISLGGVGPLVYSDAFEAEHAHPYHFSLLETPHPHTPLPLPAELVNRWLMARRIAAAQALLPGQATSGLIRLFQTTLSHGYLLVTGAIYLATPDPLAGSVRPVMLPEESTWLNPPDKPPSFSLS